VFGLSPVETGTDDPSLLEAEMQYSFVHVL